MRELFVILACLLGTSCVGYWWKSEARRMGLNWRTVARSAGERLILAADWGDARLQRNAAPILTRIHLLIGNASGPAITAQQRPCDVVRFQSSEVGQRILRFKR